MSRAVRYGLVYTGAVMLWCLTIGSFLAVTVSPLFALVPLAPIALGLLYVLGGLLVTLARSSAKSSSTTSRSRRHGCVARW